MDRLPLQTAYGLLHAWMQGQGIKCMTAAERRRREQESAAMLDNALKF